MLDAEVQIAPQEEESRSFDAGFEKLDGVGCRDDEAADDESSGGSNEDGRAERAQLEWEPRERALNQRAANGAQGQACEEDAEAHDQLVTKEAFKVGIAELRRLADEGRDKKDGSETKATAAYGLEQPKRGEMDLTAVQHGAYFTLTRLTMAAIRRRKGSTSRKHRGFHGTVTCWRGGAM